jgi:hypothetical protein
MSSENKKSEYGTPPLSAIEILSKVLYSRNERR